MSEQHEHQSKHDPQVRREPGCSLCAVWQHPQKRESIEMLELKDARIAYLERQVVERDAELARLRAEGVPGVMHEVDKAFYDLTVAERDYARRQVGNRDATIAQLRHRLARAEDQET